MSKDIVDMQQAGCPLFVVVAHRWGLRDAHSYVVGAYITKEEADDAAVNHLQYRGGKYGIEVVECAGHARDGGMNTLKQVSYYESHYYGCAGQNRSACCPADSNKERKLYIPKQSPSIPSDVEKIT